MNGFLLRCCAELRQKWAWMLAPMQLQLCAVIGRNEPQAGSPQPTQAGPVILHPQAQTTLDQLALGS